MCVRVCINNVGAVWITWTMLVGAGVEQKNRSATTQPCNRWHANCALREEFTLWRGVSCMCGLHAEESMRKGCKRRQWACRRYKRRYGEGSGLHCTYIVDAVDYRRHHRTTILVLLLAKWATTNNFQLRQTLWRVPTGERLSFRFFVKLFTLGK